MIWYVHRNAGGSIASAHGELQPDYATEALDDATNTEIQQWLAAARNPVPAEVRNWQGRAVMQTSKLASGQTYDAAVLAEINALPSPQNTFALAAYQSSDFLRSSPTLNQLLAGIGLTSAQIDQLFLAAAALSL